MRRLLAVLGDDVSASLSPLLHRAAASACDLDVAYVPISCEADRFEETVAALQTLGALGANVTIPHKAAALALCTTTTPDARAIGAVNTLRFAGAAIEGHNTDGPGMTEVFQQLPSAAFDRVHVLGAGGAARAVAWALGQRDHGGVTVSARRLDRAEAVAGIVGARAEALCAVPGASLIVSALPGAETIADQILSWIKPSDPVFVLDLAYGGRSSQSPLVARARAQGHPALDGRHLLAAQAAHSLAWWTGGELSCIRPAMRAVLALDDDLKGQL